MTVNVTFLLNIWMKLEMNLFCKIEHEDKIELFESNKLKFQPRA